MISFIFYPLLFFCLADFRTLYAGKTRKINLKINLHGEHSPIIVSLDKSGLIPKYEYPTLKDPENISIPAGKNVKVFCPGKTNRRNTKVVEPGASKIFNTELEPSRKIESIECAAQDGKFKVGSHASVSKNNVVSLNNIHCKEITEGAILRKVNKKCGSGQRYEIGYDLGSGIFLKTTDLCHVELEHETLWAHAVIAPVNQEKYRYKGSKCNYFKTGKLYKGLRMTVDSPYDSNKAFVPGQWIAWKDKFYKSEQDSTCFYVNTVPMWRQIKSGNWFFVEEYIRKLAYQKNSDIEVWAGGIGNPMNDNNHKNVLKLDDKIPVPQVLFKCAVDKIRKEGLCFLVVNNPNLSKTQVEESGNEYIVCEKYNRCKEINPNYSKKQSGYFYCCRLADFYGFYEKVGNKLGMEDLGEFKNYKEMSTCI